jgi:two-component system, cell cycle response regulator DivK
LVRRLELDRLACSASSICRAHGSCVAAVNSGHHVANTEPSLSQAPCVLIVDHDEDTREMYRVVLDAQGFRVLGAHGPMEALSAVAECVPDVIVAEVSIPQAEAIDLLVRFQTSPLTAGIPVIVLTGWTDAPTHERAARAGAAAILTKPCLPEALVSAIARVLEGTRGVES